MENQYHAIEANGSNSGDFGNDELKRRLQNLEERMKFLEEQSIDSMEELMMRSPIDGYLNLNGLSSMFIPHVGAKVTGILLRKLGLAQKHSPHTTPYQNDLRSGLAVARGTGKYTAYCWNAIRILELIENRLQAMGLFSEFHSHTNIEARKAFIEGMPDYEP